jgi:hypothetical protein
MGYYTQYELSTNDGKIEEHMEALEAITGYASYYMNGTGQECKWYKHKEHLHAYSKLHPNTVFELNGEGEASGDIWTIWFKNGKSQHEKAVMTIAPFDEGKLA